MFKPIMIISVSSYYSFFYVLSTLFMFVNNNCFSNNSISNRKQFEGENKVKTLILIVLNKNKPSETCVRTPTEIFQGRQPNWILLFILRCVSASVCCLFVCVCAWPNYFTLDCRHARTTPAYSLIVVFSFSSIHSSILPTTSASTFIRPLIPTPFSPFS
jgi:hypothetical protein